ncbi:lysophospholipid acyltransferase family protein [uncultured Desulfuromonas sp.]|uniref:lysophospholipid acyltransferase family protein n=1 Tax=uncultured Desulfuromonas sp. TaxID=181013 RepID=UPI002AAAA698|nr:lysophospholipid acyltransferase family protein [uncultured Desulfuromonas sp.]
MKRIGDWLLMNVAPLLAAQIIRLLAVTSRKEIVGAEAVGELWQQDQPVILSFWHDQLLLMAQGYQGPGSQILISASKDGELIARTMHHLGQHAVRGSSSRGGRAAFKQLVRLAREAKDLVITPDGPRGPRHELKEGVVQLARLSGRPVVPMALVASRGHRFASWDRFLLPYPFGRLVYAYGTPQYCAKEDDPQQFRQRLEQAMTETQLNAEQRLESYGLSAV